MNQEEFKEFFLLKEALGLLPVTIKDASGVYHELYSFCNDVTYPVEFLKFGTPWTKILQGFLE